MREDVFIPTQNYQKLQSLCEDLLSTSLGLEMATVVGSTGRGKTTAAERLIVVDPRAVLIRFQDWMTPRVLMREIAFILGGTRPRSGAGAYELIQSEMALQRRIIMVDEVDRMTLRHVNTLRDLHDALKVPVVMIGEEMLSRLIEQERRIKSRVAHQLRFEPLCAIDVVVFYRNAMGQAVTPKQAAQLAKHSAGDFRIVVNDAVQMEKKMKASGIEAITDELTAEVCREDDGKQGA